MSALEAGIRPENREYPLAPVEERVATPVDPVRAIEILTNWFDFPSTTACREALTKLQRKRGAEVVPRIPNPNRL